MNTQAKHLILLSSILLCLSACNKNEKNIKESATSTQTEFVTKIPTQKNNNNVGMLLPDFAQLVAQEGSKVVNIQAIKKSNSEKNQDNTSNSNDPFEEFFKRLMPNNPDFSEQEEANSANFGSGVIISADGYILTNTHVIKNQNQIKVSLNDKREYVAKVIGADEKSDIALLKIEAHDLPVAKIGDPDQLKSGEWVAAIGAPFGFDNSITAGIVSAKGRTLPNESYTPFIQTDVAINPGNSGGPLFNLKGQVVGINSQIYSQSGGYMGISFAIPIDVAINVADQLKATGKVQRGQLGVIIQEVNYDLAKSFGLDKPTGALVAQVVPNGPASKADIQVGDIIRSVNGETIRSSNDLPMAIGAITPGSNVKLGIWRQGKEIQTEVILGSLSENNTALLDKPTTIVHSDNLSTFEAKEAGLTMAIENGKDGKELVIYQSTGAAANSGLKRGDIIRQVNNSNVNDEESFTNALKKAGKNVPILVQRGDNAIFIAMTLP